MPYRQWVLAYPRKLRLAFARDPRAASESATIFLREVFRAQRKRARREGARRPQLGAICATQRFGSRLDLNVHHHAVLPDGAFTLEGDKGAIDFLKLAPPTRDDLSPMLQLMALNRRLPGKPAILRRLVAVFEQMRNTGKAAAFLRAYQKAMPDDPWASSKAEQFRALGLA